MATFVGRLRKGPGHIGESLGRGLTSGLQQRGVNKERQRVLQEQQVEKDNQRIFMRDFADAPDREFALNLPKMHPEVFKTVEQIKTFQAVVDAKFPVEDDDIELTEAVQFWDTDLEKMVSRQVTASQQVKLSKGDDPAEMDFAMGAKLTYGGVAGEVYKFFNQEDEFMGEFPLEEGKGKGFTSEFTRNEKRRVADAKDGDTGLSPEFRAELIGALAEQGNDNPTERDINREAFYKSELSNSTKSLQLAFNGMFDGDAFLRFPDALSGARFGMAIDIQDQMIRQGLRRTQATRISKSIAVDQIAATDGAEKIAVSIEVLNPVTNENRMRVNVPYRVKNAEGNIVPGIYEIRLTNGKFIIIDGRVR